MILVKEPLSLDLSVGGWPCRGLRWVTHLGCRLATRPVSLGLDFGFFAGVSFAPADFWGFMSEFFLLPFLCLVIKFLFFMLDSIIFYHQ